MGVRLRTRNFDARGMTVGRLFRRHLLGKPMPMWFFSNGAEFKHILALAVRHYLGYPIAYLTTRYERQWIGLHGRWRRLMTKPEGRRPDHPDKPA